MTLPVSVLAVDPGYEQSAWCRLEDGAVAALGMAPNGALRQLLAPDSIGQVLAIEAVESYGMPVGREVFRTVLWSGRFAEVWRAGMAPVVLVPRRAVKLALCGTSTAKDANVRRAVLDRMGEPPTKERPNGAYPRRPVRDEWSALAIALTYEQLVREGRAGELETLP